MSPAQHNDEEPRASRIPVENCVKAFAVGEQLLHSNTWKNSFGLSEKRVLGQLYPNISR